ncbi:peptide ABC transporter substrate-binding protein [Clostridium sp. WILCCON 0269]|uniref:Peptide ABC transporter substrate-binding protein n=1 Tax=Candidatus Clostridium eludens TaxID=3381663 RepID=A0ABW8SEL5_9CLOT
MKKLIYIILIVLIISVISITLSGGALEKRAKETQTNSYKNSLVYNLGELPDNLIMMDSDNIRQKDILANTFEGLVSSDEKGSIIPALAESWSISEEGTSYTFKIRKNAKWSNGTNINAYDFVNFFSEILKPGVKNIYADQLDCVFGVEDYRKGKCNFKDVAITALDSHTLCIRLNYPCNYLLNILSQPIYGLRNIDYKLIDWKKDYKSILYSGSFTISNLSEDQEITLKKNANYWNKIGIKSSNIVITSLKTSESALAAFENYKINVFTDPPLGEIKNIKNQGQYVTATELEGTGIVFNLKKEGITRQANFRKAVSLSIDRDDIVKNILKGTSTLASSYIPDYVGNGLDGNFINKSFFAANAQGEAVSNIMKNLNYDGEKKSLQLIYVNTVENKKVCDEIANNLKKYMDINVKCVGYELNSFNNEIKNGNYDMAQIDYRGYYSYPLPFFKMWQSSSTDNLYGYSNIEIDNKLTSVIFEKDAAKKIEIFKDIENILLEDMPIIPLYFNNTVITTRNYVKGIYTNKMGNVKLDKAYLSNN